MEVSSRQGIASRWYGDQIIRKEIFKPEVSYIRGVQSFMGSFEVVCQGSPPHFGVQLGMLVHVLHQPLVVHILVLALCRRAESEQNKPSIDHQQLQNFDRRGRGRASPEISADGHQNDI